MAGKLIQPVLKQWISLVTFSLVSVGSATLAADDAGGGDSPQAVFRAAQAAGAKKDYGALVRLVAPSERVLTAFGTDMGVGLFLEMYEGERAEELKKRYQAIQKKYGIAPDFEAGDEKLQITQDTPQEVIDAHVRKRAQRLYGHVDATEYVPDLMAIILGMPEMSEGPPFPQGEISDLRIEGDRATGKAGEKTISFIREGGQWYLTADIMN